MDSRASICRPSKLFRSAVRIVFYAQLTWILLALLWAFLPSPTVEHEGDNGTDYATKILRSGKTLTRVYDANAFHIPQNDRQGFALDYTLDLKSLTLDLGWNSPLPLTVDNATLEGYADLTKRIVGYTRTGDTDGANLPWFTFADSVLLYSWIQGEGMNFLLLVHWTKKPNDISRLELGIAVHREPEGDMDSYENTGHVVGKHGKLDQAGPLLLSLEFQGSDSSTIVVTVPEMPLSSSPSRTYLIRLVIIHIIAPAALLIANIFGNAFGGIIEGSILVFVAIFLYGFLLFAIVFSLWRLLKGPSFEDTVEMIQGRLERLNEDERLRFLKIERLREMLDSLFRNETFKTALDICRNGWHPERDRARTAETLAEDAEKGLKSEEGPEKIEGFSSHK